MEFRISPDKTAIGIKRDLPDDHPLLWGIMTKDNGGHYGPAEEVEDWTVVAVPED